MAPPRPADRLLIHDLATSCRLGVTEAERAAPQPVWFDLELAIDAARAAKRDDVRDAVDYARLVREGKGLAESRSWNLLETLAEVVAARILQDFATPRVVVRVKKRALSGIDYAAVEVRRRLARPGR